MSQTIHNNQASPSNSKTLSSVPLSAKNNLNIIKRVVLAIVTILSLIGVVTTLTLAIIMSMPSLAAAVIVFSIIAVACYILLYKQLKIALSSQSDHSPQNRPNSQPTSRNYKISPPSSPFISKLTSWPAPRSTTLLNNWIQLSSSSDVDTPKFDPIDTETTFTGWKCPNSKTTLVSTCGNVTETRFITQNLKPMLVNISPPYRSYRGEKINLIPYQIGHTNRAFSKAVNIRGWKNSTEGKVCLDNKQCTAGKWINPNGTNNDSNPAGPAFLAQLSTDEYTPDITTCYPIAIESYRNCLAKAKEKQSNYVQVPLLLSEDTVIPKNIIINGCDVRELWADSIKCALAQAAQDFAIQNPEYPIVIVLVEEFVNPFINIT
ncbi:phage holin family protein [Chlamydia sp. 12-01]|uniref:phage holin family protein n=1 Tax=Chlamydia sp. 12-01 TaxID=3002742 RepID=UPI0035D4F474